MINFTKSEYSIFTVCNLAYLPKALALAESVKKYNTEKLKIFIFDKKIQNLEAQVADIFWMEDMNVPNYLELAFKYDIIEFSTSLKPFISLELLKKNKKIIFLDPDTFMFSSAQSILSDLDVHSVVLTPHYTTPQTDHASESDVGMMRFGSFNLGFFAVRNSSAGLYFLNWWSKRCIDFSYMESQFGLSTDQKWVTIAPCFFQDLYVSFNLGYNAAPWNSFERKIDKNSNGKYIVNGKYELVFFHFSNFDRKDLQYINKRSLYEKGVTRLDILELAEIYDKVLVSKTTDIANTQYAYDYMSDGEYISPTLRRAYACVVRELPDNHNPFDSKGLVGAFARKNYLLEKKTVRYKQVGYAEITKNQLHFKVIYLIMRFVLKLIGPNRFFQLSRLMVYLSSYRQTRGLWKL